MSLPESDSILSSIPTLSLDDLPIVRPRPILGSRGMSLPHVRKRIRALRPESKVRRKVSQNAVASSSYPQHPQDVTAASTTQPAFSSVNDQATVTVVPQDSYSDEPSRKRGLVLQWLVQQAQRLERLRQELLRHRDSMFNPQDLEEELKRASRDANATVLGPHGEPVPERVIDHFFILYPACGSDWRDSARWERHRAECSSMLCDVCKPPQGPPDTDVSSCPSPLESPRSEPLRSSSVKDLKPLKEPKSSKDFHFSNPFRRSRSSEQKQKRRKSPASDELHENASSLIDDELVSPRTQLPEYSPHFYKTRSRPSKSTTNPLDHVVQRARQKPVRCSIFPTTCDPSRIPVPTVPNLKAESSEALDLRDSAHRTGRPYEYNPFELLHQPLPQHYKAPSAPQLKPEQCVTPIPAPLQLEDSSQESSNDSLMFNMSPLVSADPSATNVQRGFRPSSRLRNAFTVTPDDSYTIANILNQDDGLEMPRTRKRNTSAVATIHRSPAPAALVRFPPTPPDSRHTSTSFQAGATYTTYGGIVSPPAEAMSVPGGPADRDWATCELSDTTGSSLPDCPVM